MCPIKKPVVSCLEMNRQKALNLLGMAMRAGKLVTGEDLTVKAIRNKQVRLVLIANDTGKNTSKKVKDKASFYQIPYLDTFNSEELSHAIGKPRMIIGVSDSGFAKRLEELIMS